jgi:hypothetical protein
VFRVRWHTKPRMSALFPAGEGWGRKAWIGEAPHGNPAVLRPLIGDPIKRCPAGRAEVEVNREAGVGDAAIDLTRTFWPDPFLREVCPEVYGRAGAVLASFAVAHVGKRRFA